MFLVQFGTNFLLIDAGPPGQEYADILLKGLKKEVGNGQLRLVVLTHGHIDHVGGLPALKQAFPDAHVAFHTEESPYLIGVPQLSRLCGQSVNYTHFASITTICQACRIWSCLV